MYPTLLPAIIENEVHYLHWAYCGDRMLVYQLLPSVRIKNDRKIIEALYQAFKLKTIGQINRYGNMLFSDLIQKYIL
jgi:hypothetical protein